MRSVLEPTNPLPNAFPYRAVVQALSLWFGAAGVMLVLALTIWGAVVPR